MDHEGVINILLYLLEKCEGHFENLTGEYPAYLDSRIRYAMEKYGHLGQGHPSIEVFEREYTEAIKQRLRIS